MVQTSNIMHGYQVVKRSGGMYFRTYVYKQRSTEQLGIVQVQAIGLFGVCSITKLVVIS